MDLNDIMQSIEELEAALEYLYEESGLDYLSEEKYGPEDDGEDDDDRYVYSVPTTNDSQCSLPFCECNCEGPDEDGHYGFAITDEPVDARTEGFMDQLVLDASIQAIESLILVAESGTAIESIAASTTILNFITALA